MNQMLLKKDCPTETVCDSIHTVKDLQQKIELLHFAESQQAVANYIKGYSIEEIAEQTGKSEEAVRRLLKSSLNFLSRG